jgi:hypothetical protein
MITSCLAAALPSASAGAAGILPPNNPSVNIAPSGPTWIASIDSSLAQEGVGPINLNTTQLASMPFDQQVLTVFNAERVVRGLPPITNISPQLDALAQAGANAGTDPSVPSGLAGSGLVTWGGAVWSGGQQSPLEADYYWMYFDGLGSLIINGACSLLTPSGCWGHRDIILHQFSNCAAGGPQVISMGAGYSPTGGGSIGAVIVGTCPASSGSGGGVPGSNQTPSPTSPTSPPPPAPEVPTSSNVIGIAPLPNGSGYWEAAADGTVAAFGAAPSLGSVPGSLNAPIVAIAATPDGGGYWLVGSDGGIFSFGDAAFYGSTGALHLNKPIVGIASTHDGKGYWMVASDGGIFSFGDATFLGSMGGQPLNQPIVGIAVDPATGGYWEVATDGGIFSFGAPFLGSTGNLSLNKPIVGMEASPNGQGYRFVASDGGIFSFGQAPFDGSTGALSLAAPIVGMAADNVTNGYWLAAADGGIFTFGGASYLGRLVG